MIVGTAGHIDHGKTTLVRALTGVDTDRLPEEKKRGISIELGYAYLDVPGWPERVGFIDVPGHERLVHTMLAGATGIDFALLLVAADDGVMPQTREHLAVLSLLGLTRGAVVITKTDRVDAGRLAAVRAEIPALVAGTGLAAAPVVEVSAATGVGLAALRDLLFEAARVAAPQADAALAPRLAVDRAFSLDGIGTVVTGTLHAGRIAVGDELQLGGQRARVRSLHAQNQEVSIAEAGQRCAVALAGIDREQVSRGEWLTSPEVALTTQRLDAELTLWPGEPKPLRSGMRVHLHLGAQASMASVAVLDGDQIEPGASARVQLVTDSPVGAWHGDRLVLRDAGATRTVAGGRVLDPFAPMRYRRTPERLAELSAWQLREPAGRLQALQASSVLGLDLRRWRQAEGRAPAAAPPELAPGSLLDHDWALSAQAASIWAEKARTRLRDFHARYPDELGPDATRLRRLVAPRLPEPLWRALLAREAQAGRLAQRGGRVHLPEHGVQLSATEQRIAQKVAPLLAAAGFEGAWARDLAHATGEGEPLMRGTLARLARQGELHQVVKDLFYDAATAGTLAGLARAQAAANDGIVKAAGFRDAAGLGRKRAIQVLEYFDRVGLLRRVGDEHRLRADCALFEECEEFKR